MTAKRIAERALDAAQTQALIGEETRTLIVLLEALNLIQRYGNSIPEGVEVQPHA